MHGLAADQLRAGARVRLPFHALRSNHMMCVCVCVCVCVCLGEALTSLSLKNLCIRSLSLLSRCQHLPAARGGKRAALHDSDDEEAAPVTKSTKGREEDDDAFDSDEEFVWKYDNDMMGDEADKEYLASLSELKREEILLKRSEEYERAKTYWERRRKRKLEQAKQSAKTGRTRADDDDEDAEASLEEDEAEEDSDYEESDVPARDDGAPVVEDEEDYIEATFEELESIRVSRHKLFTWAHEPFFEKTVLGLVVRVSIGVNHTTNVETYRMGIIESVERGRVYSLEKTKTDLHIRVRHGSDIKRFRMAYVSNKPIAHSEYVRWADATKRSDGSLVMRSHVKKKLEDLAHAKDYIHKGSDVAFIVASKKRVGVAAINKVAEKERLQRELARAELTGDKAEVDRLQEELDRVMVKQVQAYKMKEHHQAQVARVNERNRLDNRVKMQRRTDEERRLEQERLAKNSSVRRPTQPRISGSIKKLRQVHATGHVDAPKANPEPGTEQEPAKRDVPEIPAPVGPKVDLDDLDDLEIHAPSSGDPASVDKPTPAAGSSSNGATRKRGGIDLNAYKQKMGLF
ncbi:uncharacterized protein MONBRDRAFT_34337 [Monosiga brevicollis MX1]|uniref:Plus3 domain-containing protein n=1 Tax=Monosiga brevicollis TaxID=81824 RepID=A9VB16_MONBE|nr:uncharacterized protein MONBRDRAFT_34337 [Monosiga brevicollis MX1]EDQ85260.1 predicted protein [Monosiga brevicollis MX1]|eukprot:XP_001749881.1 hypothetical protein [Monosiga brevicollis MX1]